MATAPPARARIVVATVLQTVVDTYGKTFAVLLPAALIVYTPVALIAAITSDSVGGALLASIVALIASALYTGMVVRTVYDVQDGRAAPSFGHMVSSVTHVLMRLILVGLVVGVAFAIGLVPLLVPGLILVTIWSVAAPVVVVERRGVCASLARSHTLVSGNGWQVFGVIASVFAIILVVSIVIGSIGAIGDSFLLIFIVQLLLNVVLAPIFALATAVLYFALRRAQGQPVVTDPATGAFALPQAPAITSGADAFGNPRPPAPSAPPPTSP